MSHVSSIEKAEHIAGCLELAILLEVSGYPKPGNVHRTADFPETTFEQYLASAVAIAPSFRMAVEQGIKVLVYGRLQPLFYLFYFITLPPGDKDFPVLAVFKILLFEPFLPAL